MIISKTLNESIDLYRIMPLDRFLEMLVTHKNVMVRPSAWNDPYESLILKCHFMKNSESTTRFDEKHWYGQCWSANKESDALWQIYTKGDIYRAIQIKTTSDIFKALLPDDNCYYFMEYVKYTNAESNERNVKKEIADTCFYEWCWGIATNYDEIVLGENYRTRPQIAAAPMLLTKRAPFNYEQEIRILCFFDEPQNEKLLKIDIPDLGSFIQEIVLDPWTPDGYADVVKDVINKYIPGKDIPVSKSDLYSTKLEKGLLFDPYHYYDEYKKRTKSNY